MKEEYLIPLSRGKFAIVDKEGYDKVKHFKWCYAPTGYAVRKNDQNTGPGIILMHRFLLNSPKGMVTDHVNGNKLDNRYENIRLCIQKDNVKNRTGCPGTSKYKGVSWEKRRKHWIAYISVDYKRIHIGSFKEEKDAAEAYNIAAKKHHGKYARLNVID